LNSIPTSNFDFIRIRYADWNKIIDKIEKGERKKIRLQEIKDIIQEKVERHLETVYHTMYPNLSKGTVPREVLEKHSPWDLLMYSWSTMQFKYGHANKGWTYRQEEVSKLFLSVIIAKHH
jgi:16S rRNA C967 or C1407 C5-methylase (RsmB/RsmF family)